MAYYVDYDDKGNEIKTPKPRGPAKKGYIQVEEGVWKVSPDYKEVERKTVYARFKGGEIVETKKLSPGREPKGFVKCEIGKTVAESLTGVVIIYSKERCSFLDFKSTVKAMRVKNYGDGIVTMIGCDIIGHPVISYFEHRQVQSRIDVNLNTGDIYVWTHVYREDNPDVIISNAITKEGLF